MLTLLFGGFLETLCQEKYVGNISIFAPKVQNSSKNLQIHISAPKIQNAVIFFPHNLGVKHGKYTSLLCICPLYY